MPNEPLSDRDRQRLLIHAHTIAVVGHSDKPKRTSYRIAQFLRRVGYRVIPINPMVEHIDGDRCYGSLAEVLEPIHIVNVFRRSEFLPAVVKDAILVKAKAVWAQLGVSHTEAIAQARAAGLPMVVDTCIKVDYLRLGIDALRQG